MIKDLASELDKSPAQIVLRYLLQRNLVVIPKSINPDHIISNLQITNFQLNEKQMKVISNLNKNFRALSLEYDLPHKYYPWRENYCE